MTPLTRMISPLTGSIRAVLLFVWMLLLGAAASAQNNVLLIIADDVGVDLVGAYAEHPNPANTPNIDLLAQNGILFRNAWANPVCSPTRATMLTGRYSFRTELGVAINWGLSNLELSIDEVSLADILSPVYRTAAVGKWHLAAKNLNNLAHPQLLGFEHHWGAITNLLPETSEDAYFDFDKNVDGTMDHSFTYATTDTVDDALTLIQSFGEPWFLWVAFNAPHVPFHKPPASLHTYELPASVSKNVPIHAKAMLEALDTEMGRLLASIDPAVLANTIIVFIGDNGTPVEVTQPPFIPAQAKGTVFEGGLNVPLIISGPGVAVGAECTALVNSTDIFATVVDIAGLSQTTGQDSISLVPYFSQPNLPSLRDWVYGERFIPNGIGPFTEWKRAAREDRYKLVQVFGNFAAPTDVFLYDLDVDPFEQANLLDGPLAPEELAALDSLTNVLSGLTPLWHDFGNGLAGTNGTPLLAGRGTLLGGDTVELTLSAALETTSATLILGFTSIFAGFKGGVLVPAPDIVFAGFTTDTAGQLTLSASWPSGLPSGVQFTYQHWIVDPAGPLGFSASNAVVSTAP